MTAIAATVQAFFTERLQSQRQASPRTITAYRDTIRMLLAFTSSKTGKRCHRWNSPTSTRQRCRRS